MIGCYQNRKQAKFYHFLSQILALATTGHLLGPNIAFIKGSYLHEIFGQTLVTKLLTSVGIEQAFI